MEKPKVMRTEYTWHAPYKVTVGDTYARFFEGLKRKKVLGNVCPECGQLYIPPRPFCDICFFAPTEWIETDGSATLETYTISYVKFAGLPDPPCITGIIKVENSITNFVHFISGIEYKEPTELEEKTKIGMKLKPVWREKRVGDMFDIDHFAPA